MLHVIVFTEKISHGMFVAGGDLSAYTRKKLRILGN